MSRPRVVLRPRRAQPFFGRHPWVFAGAVERVEGEAADGDEVDLVSSAGNFVARGLFNSRSKIRVRLYSWDPEVPLDSAFFRARLANAVRLRREILRLGGPGRACRLVFSEGDYLSGLTVDQYDRWLVVQFTSLAMAQRREMFAELLAELVEPRGIYLRTERGIGQLEGVELHDGPLRGEPPPAGLRIEEGGIAYRVNLAEGQKTGFYLDQRDNRQTVAEFAPGRTVLDAFCFSGGFALHAAKAGAGAVEAVDVSEPALALGRENSRINGVEERITFVKAEVFDHMDSLVRTGRKFGVVVLDPPKFARSKGAVEEALRGYRRLYTLGIRLLEPDGILATCCCSGLITGEMLTDLLSQLAAEERRDVQILARRGQAPDHPVAATCPESAYLKCFISRVV